MCAVRVHRHMQASWEHSDWARQQPWEICLRRERHLNAYTKWKVQMTRVWTQAEEIGGTSFKATRGYHTKKLFLKSLLIDTSSDKELMRVYVRVLLESDRQNGLEPKEEDLSLRKIDIMTAYVKSGKHITSVCGIEVNGENLTCKQDLGRNRQLRPDRIQTSTVSLESEWPQRLYIFENSGNERIISKELRIEPVFWSPRSGLTSFPAAFSQ